MLNAREPFKQFRRIDKRSKKGNEIMFCPKCGSRNDDKTKYCRACGADLSNVLKAVEGKLADTRVTTEEHLDIYSSGIRKLVLALGFLIVSAIVYGIPGDTYFWLLILLPMFPLLASGISMVVKANRMKAFEEAALKKTDSLPLHRELALSPGDEQYIPASPTPYKTDDLAEPRSSVTDQTTKRLKIDNEVE